MATRRDWFIGSVSELILLLMLSFFTAVLYSFLKLNNYLPKLLHHSKYKMVCPWH